VSYLSVDGFFLSQGSGLTFLVCENLVWMALYIISSYLCYTSSRYRLVAVLIAGINAGRVSRSIVDPYGVIGDDMVLTHMAVFLLLVLLGATVLAWALSERGPSDAGRT